MIDENEINTVLVACLEASIGDTFRVYKGDQNITGTNQPYAVSRYLTETTNNSKPADDCIDNDDELIAVLRENKNLFYTITLYNCPNKNPARVARLALGSISSRRRLHAINCTVLQLKEIPNIAAHVGGEWEDRLSFQVVINAIDTYEEPVDYFDTVGITFDVQSVSDRYPLGDVDTGVGTDDLIVDGQLIINVDGNPEGTFINVNGSQEALIIDPGEIEELNTLLINVSGNEEELLINVNGNEEQLLIDYEA